MSINKPLAAFAFCTVFLSCIAQVYSQPSKDRGEFAVVELFTSEGCSSCPAADALLAKISKEYRQGVYVMEYHVDYWNYIGWKDVFSSPLYTQRQQHYAQLFHLNSTYTPQAIVNGRAEMVGSESSNLHSSINNALQQANNRQIILSAKPGNRSVQIDYSASIKNNELLNIALVQKKAETNVRRGENSGKKLKHINIVRSLTTIDNGKTKGAVDITLPEGLSASEVSFIAFTQEKDTWKITGAASL